MVDYNCEHGCLERLMTIETILGSVIRDKRSKGAKIVFFNDDAERSSKIEAIAKISDYVLKNPLPEECGSLECESLGRVYSQIIAYDRSRNAAKNLPLKSGADPVNATYLLLNRYVRIYHEKKEKREDKP